MVVVLTFTVGLLGALTHLCVRAVHAYMQRLRYISTTLWGSARSTEKPESNRRNILKTHVTRKLFFTM